MSLPLDKQFVVVDCNADKKIPALHPSHKEKAVFVSYQPPPADCSDRGEMEEWLERLRYISEDLHWLLQLPYQIFWCQAIFDDSLRNLIKSYLSSAPRCYDGVEQIPAEAREQHAEIHRLVFMTCLRMATYKESKDHYLTPEVFGDILYQNYLFDIPKLFDLCALYHYGNGPLLSKMVSNIFIQQPQYLDDLRQTVPAVLEILDAIQTKCGFPVTQSPVKLTANGRHQDALVTMTTREFQDLLFYLVDTAMTLEAFLETYPPASAIFQEVDILSRLASFYEVVIPAINAAIKSRQNETYSQKVQLKAKYQHAKRALLHIFRLIINHCCLQPLLEGSSTGGDTDKYIEEFLHVMSSVLNERHFLADYEGLYCFHDDADLLTQASGDLDDKLLHHVQHAINSAFTTFGKRKKPSGAITRGGRTSPDGSPGPPSPVAGSLVLGASSSNLAALDVRDDAVGGAESADHFQVDDYDELGACAPAVTGVELNSLITSVKDLFPDLGDGFVKVALEEHGYDVERVVHALLEDKLPPSLQELDRSMPRERSDPDPEPVSILDKRHNIYDYDEFDVFHADKVDTTRIHMGKREQEVSLDDKADILAVKATYEEYGNILPSGSIYDDYDDEYDDTYDGNNVGADDADSADELTTLRPIVTPRVLAESRESQQRKAAALEEEESGEEEASAEAPKDGFVEDPAKLRARAEERAKSKAARKGHGVQNPPRKHDVVGRAKGQGQDAEVLRNRRWKEQHKGGNRRNLADKKRLA